jgi:hypothetical protein
LGEPENIEIINTMKDYADDINSTCKVNLTKFKRRYDKFIKTSINLDKEEGKINSTTHNWLKLPLEKETTQEFFDAVYNELQHFYPREIIKTIINNSFSVSAFDEDIKFLDVEYERSGDMYIAFKNICTKYKNMIPRNIDIIDSIEKKSTKKANSSKGDSVLLRNRFKTINTKEQYNDATSTLNFAKIMFVTFSKVRENFILNDKYKFVEDYLTNSVCKNLSLRKKNN